MFRDVAGAASLLVLAVCASAAACAGNDVTTVDAGANQDGCARVLPPCPSSAPPTYAADVAPNLARYCTTCHFAGSTRAREDFTTYAKVYAARGSILDQVYACAMPPAPSTTLPDAYRAKMLTWLVCGARDD